MSLLAIKNYLMQVRMASLSSISIYFNAEPDTLREMLKLLQRKGCVRQCMKTPACGTSCGKCNLATTEIYEWVA